MVVCTSNILAIYMIPAVHQGPWASCLVHFIMFMLLSLQMSIILQNANFTEDMAFKTSNKKVRHWLCCARDVCGFTKGGSKLRNILELFWSIHVSDLYFP